VLKEKLRMEGPFDNEEQLIRAAVAAVNSIRSSTFLKVVNRGHQAMIRSINAAL
jgi:hypothetical protein